MAELIPVQNDSSSEAENMTSSMLAVNDSRVDLANITLYYQENIIDTTSVQALFYMIYSIIFLLGIIGNCLVIYAVFRNKAMQTVTNYFILNLALSGILLCVLCVPFTPLYTFLQKWIFGAVLCHLVTCTQGVSIYISSLTLTTIAIDRFFVIIYPFKPRMQPSTCMLLIFCTWLLSVGATIPYAIFVEHTTTQYDNETYVCQENFPGQIRLTFGSITTVLQFVIPFFIITTTYTLISLKLSSRAKSKPGSKTLRKEQADRERKRRTNRMLIAMVAVFGLSWLPLNLMNILDDISTNLGLGWERWSHFHLLFFVAHAIAMSSTCYNPFLYAWLNENFRKEFKDILPCFGRQRQGMANGALNRNRGTMPRASTACVTEDPEFKNTAITHMPTGADEMLLQAVELADDDLTRPLSQSASQQTASTTLVTDL